jgi:DNA repair exonuclease SbcCD ATPase subunit
VKINKIHLQNFKKHVDSTLDLGETAFVCVRGANHAGKSSIREAISMGLCLTTSSLDAQGRNFWRKIKRGETKAVVTLDVQGKSHLIQQTVVLNTNTSGRTSRAVCLDDEGYKPLPFENFLTRYKDALLVVCNSDYFLNRMGEKEQKALLAKLALPERYAFPDEITQAVYRAIGANVIDFEGEPFAVIDKAYKKLYEERAIINRQVKEFVIPDPLAAVTGVDSESLQKELEEARAEQKKISADKDAAVKAANETEVKRATLSAKVGNLREKCKEIDADGKRLAGSVLAAEKLAELNKIVEKKQRLDELSDRKKEIQFEIEEQKKEIERFRGLSGEGAVCPKCDQPITKEYIADTIKLGEAALGDRAAELERINKELEGLGDIAGAATALAAHIQAVSNIELLGQSLAEKIKEGKAAMAELNALPASVDAGAPFAESLTVIDSKINGILEQLRPVIAAEERAKEIKSKTQAKAKLQEQADSLDKLVDYFGKDGIKAKLLAEHVGGFENKLNSTLEMWGYKCALSIDPYEFQVTNADGDTNLVTELSDSEQLMFSVALQCAVSRAAGIGFIVADRLDTFLAAERSKANRALYTATQDGSLEQAILIFSEESMEVPKLPNSAFFMVTNGTVKRL